MLLLLFAQQATSPTQADSDVPVAKPGWVLTFDDEFNSRKLNTSVWNVSNFPSLINDEKQYYTPDSVTVMGGYLRIITRHRVYRGRDYTSGEITTQHRFRQRYGWFEARMRFPTTTGLWGCVYLLPESGYWPPEIDIAEYLTMNPQELYLTNHWPDGQGNHLYDCNGYSDYADDFTQWHLYAIDWEPGRVNWFMDGRLVASTLNPPPSSPLPVLVSSVPMYICINDCIGTFGGPPAAGPWPQYLDVDYVRAYRRVQHGSK